MQKFLACSILSAATAQDCDICQGRPIPEGAMTLDGHDCVETVPFCEENLMICGGECEAAQMLVGGPCCPIDQGPCDICQDRPIADVILESGYSCAESIPFCNAQPGHCFATCAELEASMGPECCPAPDPTLEVPPPSDGSEAPSDGSEAPSDGSEAPPCDVCQGRAIIDLILETGYSCADSVPYCVDNVAACGGTCEEVQAALGTACCPSADEAVAADPTTVAPVTTTVAPPAVAAPAIEEQQPAQQQAAAAEEEDDDGFGSGAVTGAKAKLMMFLVMTVIGLLR